MAGTGPPALPSAEALTTWGGSGVAAAAALGAAWTPISPLTLDSSMLAPVEAPGASGWPPVLAAVRRGQGVLLPRPTRTWPLERRGGGGSNWRCRDGGGGGGGSEGRMGGRKEFTGRRGGEGEGGEEGGRGREGKGGRDGGVRRGAVGAWSTTLLTFPPIGGTRRCRLPTGRSCAHRYSPWWCLVCFFGYAAGVACGVPSCFAESARGEGGPRGGGGARGRVHPPSQPKRFPMAAAVVPTPSPMADRRPHPPSTSGRCGVARADGRHGRTPLRDAAW